MSIEQAEESSIPPDVISEEAVVAYLAAHPDFFERRSDLVARVRIPHASGGAVSLIEHQVEVLRKQLGAERRRLAHLIGRAREYEALSGRLHGLTLLLIAAKDAEHVKTILKEALRQEFNAEAASLKLFPLKHQGVEPDPHLSAFRDFVDREHSLCGPLDAKRGSILFGDQAAGIRSAVLIPVRAPRYCGVLAIGSADAERFGVDMATDLLDRLGQIVSQKLRVLYDERS